MPPRFGPGPVFVHESIAAARRWQLYALRSLFVLGLLVGLTLAWMTVRMQGPQTGGSLPVQQLASLGQSFYIAIATMQLVLVLVIAPAATAATICLDRARGTLTHMLVTDLTNSEIVLGKLAARLAPVLALVAATVPVLALAGLLGGVIIEAIAALTLITMVLAVFGCTLALAISVRATKTHEVLMAVYGIEAVWVSGPLIWMIAASTGVVRGAPAWISMINPFVLAWAPYWWPNAGSAWQLAAVLGGALALSAGLAVYAVLRLRTEVTNPCGLRPSWLWAWLGRAQSRISAWRPSPSLDDDPVLWREWRRGRPSRLARIVWGVFIAASIASTGWGIWLSQDYRAGSETLAFVGGFQATFGLLLLSLTAPTVLAEERVRGSLDVLLTTPLSTDRIVLAKWWGAFRVVPALTLLPAIGAIFIAAGEPNLFRRAVPIGSSPPAAWSTFDRFACVCLPVAALLVQGAAVTSIGVALATWFRRLGRAVAVSVTSYAFYAFGWVLCVEVGLEILMETGLISPHNSDAAEFLAMVIVGLCPFGGQCVPSMAMTLPPSESRVAFYGAQVIVMLGILLFALVMLALTLATFDRCVGRASERPRRAPRPPRRVTGARQPHLWIAALRRRVATCPP